MTLTQLHYLVALYEADNATQAAKKLHITRPALTNGIRQLEADLGTKLVTTKNNQIHFTEQGKLAVVQARKVLQAVDDLYQAVQPPETKTFRIGLLSQIQPILDRISNYHAGKLALSFQDPDELYYEVAHRQLDLAFTVFADQKSLADPSLQFDQVFSDHLGAFAVPGTPLAKQGKISYRQLQEVNVIVSDDRYNQQFIQKIMKEYGPLNIILTTPGINLVHHLMDNETILIGRKTQLELSPYADQIQLAELANPKLNQIRFDFGWLYMSDHRFSKDERALIRTMTADFY